MRIFTLVVSVVLTATGVAMTIDGRPLGWLVVGFFGFCGLMATIEPWLPSRREQSEYRVVVTGEGIACEHPARMREAIRWEDVTRIWYVTTSDGPRLPDEWLLFEGEGGGCSLPTEAAGMHDVWEQLEERFHGFAYSPLIHGGGGEESKQLCWEREGLDERRIGAG